MPRHPPCALNNLTTKIKDARVHCAVLKKRAGEDPDSPQRLPQETVRRGSHPEATCASRPEGRPAVPSGPNSVPGLRFPHLRPSPPRTWLRAAVLIRGRTTRLPSQRSTHEHPVDGLTSNYCRRHGCGRGTRPFGRRPRQLLLRKEVIQPHLPVRLPCYDFVPIADPTFDGSLHKGWATGFGCYRLS